MIAKSVDPDFTREKLREIGTNMNQYELLELQNEMINTVYLSTSSLEVKSVTHNRRSYNYIDHIPIILVGGMYDSNLNDLKSLIEKTKNDLRKLSKNRGLDKGFDRENPDDILFVRKWKLFNTILRETLEYAIDKNDPQTFWELVEENYKTPYVETRRKLFLCVNKWVKENGYIPTEKYQLLDVLNNTKEAEKRNIEYSNNFGDFIISHSTSRHIIDIIDKINSE